MIVSDSDQMLAACRWPPRQGPIADGAAAATGESVGRITVAPSDGMVLFAQTAQADALSGDVEVAKLIRM